MAETEREIRMRWGPKMSRFLQSTTLYLDGEGAIRAGKTTGGVWKIIMYCQKYPGIHCMISRWTGDALDAQLKPRFWELCPPELLASPKPWHSDEEYVEFANGSRCYIRALKSSDEGSRYAKTAGLTLAVILVDQPEEMPEDVADYLKGRLSQKGFPHQLIFLPNPPSLDHWLGKMFPEDNSRANHEYIRFSTYDNRVNLGEEYIQALEEAYPPQHPMHKRLLLGERGVTTLGTPVYGKIFKREIHVAPVKPLAKVPLLESWDFAFHHPCVTWSQITSSGAWQVLGEQMGKDTYLEDFIPNVLRQRARYMVEGRPIWVTCDPSGVNPTSHATKKTAVLVLQEAGVYPQIVATANRPEVREYAISQIGRMLLRLTPDGPAFVADPSCATIIDGMMAGYVYPEKLVQGRRVPLKDGFYDNPMNTLEYAVLAFFASPGQMTQVARPVTDPDEDEDARVVRSRDIRLAGRAGY